MGNMSYCRWENTHGDMQDCLTALEDMEYRDGKWVTIHEAYDMGDEDRVEELNEYEQRALKYFEDTCAEMLDMLRAKMGK